MALKSRLLTIAVELPERMDEVAKRTAETVRDRAKERCPVGATGHLRDAIHIEQERVGAYRVIAGNPKIFYGMFVENGTVKMPARPFLGPALEETRGKEVQAIGAGGLRAL